MTDTSLEAARALALDLSRPAGDIALRHFRTDADAKSKSAEEFDPVTAADLEIETFLRARIRAAFPDHLVTGEELPDDGEDADHSWIIDPIDGTRGFLLGLPTWGILIAYLEHGRPVLGLMYQPLTDDLFFGDPDGAWLRRGDRTTRLRAAGPAELGDADLCCTHPDMFGSQEAYARFEALARSCRSTRFGTDCYGYCSLAMGRAHLVVEGGLKRCDVAPLIPIVRGAGGIISSWEDDSALHATRVVAAANATLHAAALRRLEADFEDTVD